MSEEKNSSEAKRWLSTAEDDLDAATVLRDHEKHSQCCFQCQQAAEKAVKRLMSDADGDTR